MLLPLTFGIGLGSLTTGQLVTKTGRTAVFPTFGLTVTTLGLGTLAFGISHLSVDEMPWAFGVVAVFMGTVMGVVQITVQTVAGPRMLGTGAAMVPRFPFRRRGFRHGRSRRSIVFLSRACR